MVKDKLTAQQKANKRQDEARRENSPTPYYYRMNWSEKERLDRLAAKYGDKKKAINLALSMLDEST